MSYLIVLLVPQLECELTKGKNSASFIAVSAVAAIWEAHNKSWWSERVNRLQPQVSESLLVKDTPQKGHRM